MTKPPSEAAHVVVAGLALYADGGVDVADIARHVGHSDTSTTAEYAKRLGNRPVDTARHAAELLDPTID